ncbi:hypothetical protein, partial [Nonomuraea antri]|uniref:hypothetical protein n=1 Tax=Nonomuraea antri TaxID=2730852 RepID=UPI0038B3E782
LGSAVGAAVLGLLGFAALSGGDPRPPAGQAARPAAAASTQAASDPASTQAASDPASAPQMPGP